MSFQSPGRFDILTIASDKYVLSHILALLLNDLTHDSRVVSVSAYSKLKTPVLPRDIRSSAHRYYNANYEGFKLRKAYFTPTEGVRVVG
jgi:hypothetical protein